MSIIPTLIKGVKGASKLKSILIKAKDAKESQLRIGGLIFVIIGFIIIWYMKKNGI